MTMYQRILYLAVAGAIGTLARYGLSGVVYRVTGANFPWGTLVVNLTGCFLAGVFWRLFEYRWPVSGETRIVILVGFMGAFTTFSTYILETSEFIRTAEWLNVAGNILLQNGLGVIALFAGITLGRFI